MEVGSKVFYGTIDPRAAGFGLNWHEVGTVRKLYDSHGIRYADVVYSRESGKAKRTFPISKLIAIAPQAYAKMAEAVMQAGTNWLPPNMPL